MKKNNNYQIKITGPGFSLDLPISFEKAVECIAFVLNLLKNKEAQ